LKNFPQSFDLQANAKGRQKVRKINEIRLSTFDNVYCHRFIGETLTVIQLDRAAVPNRKSEVRVFPKSPQWSRNYGRDGDKQSKDKESE
jgi:hypothetical protein